MQTKVKDVMKANPDIISADFTLKEAAQKMDLLECGVLPVGTPDTIEGMITDRDIVIRAIAKGKDVFKEKVRDYITTDVFYCSPEDTVEDAAKKMHKNQVSRLVVKDSKGKLCGILSFGCILRKDDDLNEISSVVGYAVGKKAA